MAPGFGDDPYIVQALEESQLRTVELARATNLAVSTFGGTLCDRQGLRSLLEQVDLAKILCHGFVQQREREVAGMVADHGTLPPVRAVAAARPEAASYRFSWKDCQQLASSPSVVFSAACSSGAVHIAGITESLGLFGALRRYGHEGACRAPVEY